MLLSQTAEHALRAVIFLAQQGDGNPVPTGRIAEALGAPRNYLGKTLSGLARAGLVEGVRGPAGGYRLMVRPDTLTIATLVDAVDVPGSTARCLMGDRPCDESQPCIVHRKWSTVVHRTRAPLRTTSIADLLDEAPASTTSTPRT